MNKLEFAEPQGRGAPVAILAPPLGELSPQVTERVLPQQPSLPRSATGAPLPKGEARGYGAALGSPFGGAVGEAD